MSSLVHPAHAVRQKFRPKHQVLVLKCYPKYQKNVQEVKPSSSELSYLLYYASTRRSKLQKVGAYLEKRTVSDVSRSKFGNVQVTLQIITALIEKCPRDLPLYGRYVLTILDAVVRSRDINMVEESIPTFETYSKYIDLSSLAADQPRSQQYQNIVQAYVSFASKSPSQELNALLNPPLAIRWRSAGLKAIRSVVGSEALGADQGKLLTIVMPVILENLYSDNDDILASLQERAQAGEKVDVENAKKRRMSMATVATVDTIESNPANVADTTADADKMAEDEVRVLAVRCLKQIFAAGTGGNRVQVRLGTALTLKFVVMRSPPRISIAQTSPRSGRRGNWATSLIETVSRWTPVQDRFIIVVTAMETLVRSPIMESKLEMQLTLATMIDWLLSSSINLIGLSVMDVLLGFIQHTLLLLQLGGRDSKVTPHYQQSDALDLFQDTKDTFDYDSPFGELERGRVHIRKEKSASPLRHELLSRLQKCIGDLATHIYYTDQISDMMTAILARLKPSALSDVSTSTAAIQDPGAAANAIANAVSLQEDRTTDGFFSFTTARVTALRAVKDILLTANLRKSMTGATAEARSRVGIQVWEGTQWLLRDEDREVRLAYVDALLTWLKLETNRTDLQIPKEGPRKPRLHHKMNVSESGEPTLAKRAASNATRKEIKPVKSTFLQLLHLAIYENAIESPEDDADILLLHLLLSNLIERLGVNTVRQGLPMIMRLQDDITNSATLSTSKAKVNIASLVHGYFWALSEKFDFETTRCGGEVHQEISRRKRKFLWLEKIRLPALPVDHISTISASSATSTIVPEVTTSSLRLFTNRTDLIDEIASAYDESLVTPATSPPVSPGRVFSVPTLGFGYGYGAVPGAKPSKEDQLPQKVRDDMLIDWTRELLMATVEKERAKSASVTGSKTGASSRAKHYLSVNADGNDQAQGRDSPTAGQHEPLIVNSPSYGLAGGLGNLHKLRRTSTNGGSPDPLTNSSSRDSTVRVTDLKRALSGYQGPNRHSSSPLRRPFSRPTESVGSSGSESMVSFSAGDGPGNSTLDVNATIADQSDLMQINTATNGTEPTVEGISQGLSTSIDHNSSRPLPENSDRKLREENTVVLEKPSMPVLPGTYPRDTSPARPLSPGMEKQRPQTSSYDDGQRSQISIVSGFRTSESVREGRKMRRGNSNPVARKGGKGSPGRDHGPGGGRIDVGKLLAKIRIDGNNGAVVGKGEEEATVGMSRMRPPY